MLFNSFEFLFLFLPITFVVYFSLVKVTSITLARVWLLLSSLFFYSWWNIYYLPLILISMSVNYLLGLKISANTLSPQNKKIFLWTGLAFNLGLLGYYKYADFFIDNINYFGGLQIASLNLLLPLAISFFTFQQIAYLVDSYRSDTGEYSILRYAVFVSFFPQLIAGPIVHHSQMMPQFADYKNNTINFSNVFSGIFIFTIGLFKKVVVADNFAIWANYGFDFAPSLSFTEAWATSLSYTFQLYYDFSGYTDMAIGLALLFNIRLPQNFNSPYKAISIQDFWRRWHITLSQFLRDYVYIPLGGNRRGELITYNNLIITFLLGGLWHGAGWMFIVWGLLHGISLAIHRFWNSLGLKLNKAIAWFVTFNFINVTWIFFRAQSWSDASKVLRGMFLPEVPISLDRLVSFAGIELLQLIIILALFISALTAIPFRNSNQLLETLDISLVRIILMASGLLIAILSLSRNSTFLYFNF